ncbi:MAG TPA: hypothetical protein VJ723_07850, partial [Candidatus Angelobacter sp.]|nr:hypothetical protein [Candidatus Angelobacter sp.]
MSVFVLVLVAVPNGLAQTAPNDYIDRIGLPNFAVPHPVEMGFVNLPNGNLHLDFPMGPSIIQRGGKSISLKLTYDSRIYSLGWISGFGLYPYNVVGSDGGWKVILTGDDANQILSSNGCQPFSGGTCLGFNYQYST